MSFIKDSWLRSRLSFLTLILLASSFAAKSARLFVAAVCMGLLTILVVNYDRMENGAATRYLRTVYDRMLKNYRASEDKPRFWGMSAIIAFGLMACLSSDLPAVAGIIVFAGVVFFAVLVYSGPVRKHLDPDYAERLDDPKEAVVPYDIGPTEGDLPGRDKPAFQRYAASDGVFPDRPRSLRK